MKTTQFKAELKNLPAEQLTAKLTQLTQELTKSRLDHKTNKLKNTSQLKHLRYQISVIKTLLNL